LLSILVLLITEIINNYISHTFNQYCFYSTQNRFKYHWSFTIYDC